MLNEVKIVTPIKEILKEVKPDPKCLENATTVRDNLSILKLLHDEHKIKFTEKSIFNHINTYYSHNYLLKYLIEKYDKK